MQKQRLIIYQNGQKVWEVPDTQDMFVDVEELEDTFYLGDKAIASLTTYTLSVIDKDDRVWWSYTGLIEKISKTETPCIIKLRIRTAE